RARADRRLDLRILRACALDHALVERVDDHARAFVEAVARLVHVDLEVAVLEAREPAPEAEDRAAAREVIQHRHLLGHAQRIVPRHDHRTGAEAQLRGAAREPRQDLEVVGARRVVGEVMLGWPVAVEAGRLGQLRDAHLVAHHVRVARAALIVLEDAENSDLHARWPPARGTRASLAPQPVRRAGARARSRSRTRLPPARCRPRPSARGLRASRGAAAWTSGRWPRPRAEAAAPAE